MTTGTIIDIVIAAILLLAVIIGAIKGLFKTVMGLVATIVAIIAAVYLSGVFAGPATDYLYPRYEERLQQLVSEPSLHINIGAILSDATDKNIEAFMNLEIPEDYFEDGIAEDVLEITGIMNGTTNYMLTKMSEEGSEFDDVLKQAQDLGYAEKDPTADIEGHDPCRKIAILTSLVAGQQVNFEDICHKYISKRA